MTWILLIFCLILFVSSLIFFFTGGRRSDDSQLSDLLASQHELKGRLDAIQESSATHRTSLSQTTKETNESLTQLKERLSVIDKAQTNIQGLAQDIVGLQQILENKQTRGAFGEGQLEMIIRDKLPSDYYEFQPTLSNGNRPDCTVRMPNDSPVLVIDAKFPLESWQTIRNSDDPAEIKVATKKFESDMKSHIRAISERYLIPGETQDTAFMFVPSESIFADIHEQFGGIVEVAHSSRVVIVSPSLLVLSIQVILAILKDSQIRENAHLIQDQLKEFMSDLGRLDERVNKLRGRHDQTGKDIDLILTSTKKLTSRGQKIDSIELGDDRPPSLTDDTED